MSCLSSTRKAEIEARITKLEARLTLAENALDGLLSAEGIESFKFDSGEAMSWAKYYKAEELRKLISNIEANLDYYRNKLNGTGIVRLNLRRRC
jgi:hypothetical protein